MFQLIDSDKIYDLIKALRDRISEANGFSLTRDVRLTSAGASFRSNIYLNNDVGLWAWFSEFDDDSDRLYCWFGCELNGGKPLTADVEFTIHFDTTYRNVRGRSLVDERGRYCLGHTGGLGGGRGGQIRQNDFAKLIKGL